MAFLTTTASALSLFSQLGAHVGSMVQNRSLESHRLIGRTSYRRTNLWRFLLQLHRHCLFSHSCSCFCPGWRSCSACLRKEGGATVGSWAHNRSLESHRIIGRTSYRRTNIWRFLLQLHRHCLFSLSCSCFCPGWRSCSACLRKEGGSSCRVSLNRSQIGSKA